MNLLKTPHISGFSVSTSLIIDFAITRDHEETGLKDETLSIHPETEMHTLTLLTEGPCIKTVIEHVLKKTNFSKFEKSKLL